MAKNQEEPTVEVHGDVQPHLEATNDAVKEEHAAVAVVGEEHAAVAPGASQDHSPHLRPIERREVDGAFVAVDPEIEERQARIREKEAQVLEAEQNERRRLVEADRALTIQGLDQREAELDAQLARVRGDRPTEE